YIIGADYFRVMKILLLRGRVFTPQDILRSRLVAVIDQNLARSYFPGHDAVGKHLHLAGFDQPFDIVGVVRHVDQNGLDEGVQSAASPQIYVPVSQVPNAYISLLAKNDGFVVRTQTPSYASAEAIRKAIEEVNREQVTYGFESMDGLVAGSLAARRFTTVLLAFFAAAALVLASIGIYGVITYRVASRTHEIGIRVALGAQKRDVLRLVVVQGMILALVGVAAGIVAAFALTRFLSKLLFGVRPTDPLTFTAVALILLGVALLACYIPARRAAKVDPMVALRCE
ncbi:MAG: FtsX-like permease family protein, partial [Terriglobia bacterium]